MGFEANGPRVIVMIIATSPGGTCTMWSWEIIS
jgi:hypothetical protein